MIKVAVTVKIGAGTSAIVATADASRNAVLSSAKVAGILSVTANVTTKLPINVKVSPKILGPTVTETVPSSGTITLVIPAGSLSAQWLNADSDLIIDSINTTNVDSYSLLVNGSDPGALPVTLNIFDEINVKVTPTDTGQNCTVILNDESRDNYAFAFYPPKVDNTRYHIAAMRYSAINGGGGVVDIIDCSTNTIHSSVNLPPLNTVTTIDFWAGPAYDSDRDYWVFGSRLYWAFIQADPNHADFGKIINPDTGNASPDYTKTFSRGDSYAWYNFVYDPFANANGTYQKNRQGIVFMNNDSYMFARGYNCTNYANQAAVNIIPNRIHAPSNDGNFNFLSNGDLACMVRASNSLEQWTRYKNDAWNSGEPCNWKPVKSNGKGGGTFNGGFFIYVPELGKYYGGTHQILKIHNRDLNQVSLIKSMAGGGTSAYYQMLGGWAYDVENKYLLVSHYWMQTATYSRLYLVDCSADVLRGDYEIPNIDTTPAAPRHFPQMIYCPYNGYIYHSKMNYSVNANANGLGGINVYDVGNWLANGRVSVNDLFVGQITWGGTYGWNSNKYDTFHKHMAGNWIDLPFR